MGSKSIAGLLSHIAFSIHWGGEKLCRIKVHSLQWATKVLRHCHFGALKANFPPQLYDSNPPPP